MKTKQTLLFYLLPVIVTLGLIAALWLRTPYIREGSPYLYREDEAHHFNRIVNMMKSGDLNPHYFHKPSLHFYLRLPVVSAAFLWAVKKGEAQSTNDIITSDPFGVADYSFSVSHPRLLLVSRAFSVFLQLASILFTFLIALKLLGNRWLALFPAMLFVISPAAISESAVIGVDGVMTFFCLATTLLALRSLELKTKLSLLWCALCSGLAVSSKYNALPILAVPLLVYLRQKPLTLERGLIAVVLPWIAFIAASPFILISLPEFLNQLSYEIWHYAVAGHIGHMAEPGWQQITFYSRWLANDGIGLIAASLALCGLLFTISQIKKPELQVTAVFPVLFFLLMIMQRANFERNMTVIIPFVAIFCAIAFCNLGKFLPKKLLFVIAGLAFIQPLIVAVDARAKTSFIPESRVAAAVKVQELALPGSEVAIDGRLQFPRKLLERAGVSRADFSSADAQKAFQDGYEYLVLAASDKSKLLKEGFFEELQSYEGDAGVQRIIQNPAIAILKRNLSQLPQRLKSISSPMPGIKLSFSEEQSEIVFAKEPESQLWLKSSVQALDLSLSATKTASKTLTLSIFSPWPDQSLTFLTDSQTIKADLSDKPETEVIVPVTTGQKEQRIYVFSSKVHSPKALGISNDTRRLAFAIQKARIN